MATGNFTGEGQQKTVEKFVCSTKLTVELYGYLTFISALNSFLSVTAFLEMLCFHSSPSIQTPNKYSQNDLLCIYRINEGNCLIPS